MYLDVKIENINRIAVYSDEITYLEKNGLCTVFQYTPWVEIAANESKRNILKKFEYSQKIALLFKNGKLMAYVPLEIKKSYKINFLRILGVDVASDYLDFIVSKQCSDAEVLFFINEILRKSGVSRFIFTNLPESSRVYCILRQSEAFIERKKDICVHINLTYDNYNDYFQNLKKSTRQNLRTAKNRLIKSKLLGKLSVYYKEKVGRELARKLQALYEKRRMKLNIDRKDLTYKLVNYRRKIGLLTYNYMIDSMCSNKNAIVVVYEIDNEIAAFCHGQVDKRFNTISFMQVAIDEKFGTYSPGMLMFSEFIKCLFDDNEIELACKQIDLTVGNEPYKYKLGGEEHFVISGDYYLDNKGISL